MPSKKETQPSKTKFQKFEVQTIHRSQLKEAPYNPRILDKHARKKLRENIKKNGLVETLIWNKRTGFLVGGHQRLSILDELQGTDDYSLDVAVVDVDSKTEKKLNVFLNNGSAQGNWDIDKLGSIVKEIGNYDDLGFDRIDMDYLFTEEDFGSIFSNKHEAAEKEIDAIKEIRADTKAIKQLEKEEESDEEQVEEEHDEEPEESQSEIMRRKKKEHQEAVTTEDDPEFYVVLVFKDADRCDAFLKAAKLPDDQRYVDGERFATNVGLELPPER